MKRTSYDSEIIDIATSGPGVHEDVRILEIPGKKIRGKSGSAARYFVHEVLLMVYLLPRKQYQASVHFCITKILESNMQVTRDAKNLDKFDSALLYYTAKRIRKASHGFADSFRGSPLGDLFR